MYIKKFVVLVIILIATTGLMVGCGEQQDTPLTEETVTTTSGESSGTTALEENTSEPAKPDSTSIQEPTSEETADATPKEPVSTIASDGDTVRVHYTGSLDDGSIFDTSEGRDPLEFTIGDGMVIAGFVEAVKGMQVGDSKTVTIPAEQAYGPRYEELVIEVPIEDVPEGLDPQIGQQLQMVRMDGTPVFVTVLDITDTTLLLDANHSLAGKDLTFEIELVEINP